MGLEVCVIRDAGRTQIAPGSKTVLGVGPGKHLKNLYFVVVVVVFVVAVVVATLQLQNIESIIIMLV